MTLTRVKVATKLPGEQPRVTMMLEFCKQSDVQYIKINVKAHNIVKKIFFSYFKSAFAFDKIGFLFQKVTDVKGDFLLCFDIVGELSNSIKVS